MEDKFKPWQEVEYDEVYAKNYENNMWFKCHWLRDTYIVKKQITNSSILCINKMTKKPRRIHKDFLVLPEENKGKVKERNIENDYKQIKEQIKEREKEIDKVLESQDTSADRELLQELAFQMMSINM